MRAVLRSLTAWALTGALVSGLLMPAFARSVAADPDGACGPYVALDHSVEHFESPLEAPTDHCVLCHYWHAMAGASVAGRTVVSPPEDILDDAGRVRAALVPLSELTQTPPRGPPAQS